MVKRSFGVDRLNYLNRIYSTKRIRQFGQRKRLSIKEIVLLILPLILLLAIISPPKQETLTEDVRQVDIKSESYIEITVYNPDKSLVDKLKLEDYLVGVLAAEMPPDFNEEALKAQAVAARTFALSRMRGLYGSTEEHFGAQICTKPGHCQAWITKERFLEVYGDDKDWERIQRAVDDTKSIVMTYAGQLINPLYHSNSGGVTENIEEVWDQVGEVPYLKSVYSPDESQYSQFEKKTLISWDDLKKKVKNKYPDAKLGSDPKKEIEVIAWSASGRIEEIRIGSVKISGTAFRELLGLRSTNLEIKFPDKNHIEIHSRGYGHGVGMSQCGADAMGKKGFDYIEILEYYYTGIKVEEIEQ
jgi:stage II sporulation protein D